VAAIGLVDFVTGLVTSSTSATARRSEAPPPSYWPVYSMWPVSPARWRRRPTDDDSLLAGPGRRWALRQRVAERLGLPIGTVKSRLARAIATLRAQSRPEREARGEG
jgi:hypothetical protein